MSKERLEKMGVQTLGENLNERFEVVNGKVDCDGKVVTIDFLRSRDWQGGDFLPASIYNNGGEKIWEFATDKPYEGFRGVAKLFKLGEEFVIGFLRGKGLQELIVITPIRDLFKPEIEVEDGMIRLGGFSEEDLITLKRDLAKKEGIRFCLSQREQGIQDRANERRKKKANERRAEEEKKRSEKIARRKKRTEEILSRGKVRVYAEDGTSKSGTPVFGDEWKALPNRQPVVLFEDKKFTFPLEAFFVERSRGQEAQKKNLCEGVSLEKATDSSRKVIKARSITLEVNREENTYPWFDKGNLPEIKEGEADVVVGSPTGDGKYTLVRLSGEGVTTVGQYPRAEDTAAVA